jgi:hypothetical protein
MESAYFRTNLMDKYNGNKASHARSIQSTPSNLFLEDQF